MVSHAVPGPGVLYWEPLSDGEGGVAAIEVAMDVAGVGEPSIAEAKRIAALFPKSVGVKASRVSYSPMVGSDEYGGRHDERDYSRSVSRGMVVLGARLMADGVNKGVNESGLKRAASFLKHAARLGYEVRLLDPYDPGYRWYYGPNPEREAAAKALAAKAAALVPGLPL
jgi:hypothetical protein